MSTTRVDRQCATHVVGVAGPWRAADVSPPRTLDTAEPQTTDVAIIAARRGFLDTITVRFDLSSDDDRFIADWTFERPAPLPPSPVRY